MNAVEIEQAVTALAEQPFDAAEFPFAFLQAFGNKETTIKRLRKGESNKSDIAGPWGGVLQANNIHIAVCSPGEVPLTFAALKSSPATARAKARFVLATDGITLEAEDLSSDEAPIACAYPDFPNHFGFFLPLAGITTVRQIRESSFDIRATSRLNRLYVELLKDNPEWGTAERRHEMNHFMARLIFCFFAEDTNIFNGAGLFTKTIETMSAKDASNTHEVIEMLFRAMNTKEAERAAAGIPRWAAVFPYVNGGLFSGSTATPKFSRIAQRYLLYVGNLDWTKINPDIFGSMIQAVADDEERGALGMHYTSVPNILKVLNPLFLDDLRGRLEEAGDNARKLLNLRNRMAKIRVFDPACGSGNFLVIAYKQMRAIEAEINRRRGEAERRTEIPLTNFRGIELRDFPAEIARLALIIAEYQCDVLYRGQMEALAEFLPLDAQNWIVCENALQLDWLSVCPSTGTGVKLHAEDLFHTPLDQPQIDFENEGGETYICGNPPYVGDKKQNVDQKQDIQRLFAGRTDRWRSFDYVCGFLFKAVEYGAKVGNWSAAFVTTNSVTQGVQVSQFWPLVMNQAEIRFAHTSFKWSNLAAKNAGVTCVILGLASRSTKSPKTLFFGDARRNVAEITPYLTSGHTVFVQEFSTPLSALSEMLLGNFAKDGGNLLIDRDDLEAIDRIGAGFLRPIYGAQEFIKGIQRYCFWVQDHDIENARRSKDLVRRFDRVAEYRRQSVKAATAAWATKPHRFVEIRSRDYTSAIIVPRVSSEGRDYLPTGLLPPRSIVTEAFALYDAPLWNMALIASRLHLVWIATVCGKLETRYRYSNTLGWNTFPVPTLTEKNKADLTRCAEEILLAREAHFPATIAELYNPANMPADLRAAHERNDEVLERIYIGRRFRNDTERLEKLFALYTEMTAKQGKAAKGKGRGGARAGQMATPGQEDALV
ncbi:class I SAM-dependent DNA methyltransferase [Granulibacter bethesdensis]|uniref:site-specific DNA-methyltransferase (adenine-specific) n=1 Tax=Granulibacter bethesdensis (strain ATCC BAA-1260 / CGDNIH1) TaxID=391165 RepID=Q0BRY9_GRABC|nr:DNA methyltransferase [Granulibacter bethesdensis]ABI62413.1 DNA modification methyltransferase-related protein [Granulibacter bethesdensis CGDNIH1]APG30683.1 DNA modification methyltransferase-related protein [Granulibacter bethesdensis]APH52247.1 DNA modification methyltransferase-related protein [Granulibacter bethesdensis]APH64940.1 DNA modification methyltransferase-related protein [Granulibacter bethesdensis]